MERSWYPFRVAFADSFETIVPIRENFALVGKKDLFALVNRQGQLLTEWSSNQYYDRTFVKFNDRLLILGNDGTIAETKAYGNMYRLNAKLWWVSQNGRVGLIDSTGQLRVPFNFQSFHIDDTRIVAQDTNGLYGHINVRGEWLIPPTFSALRSLPHGLWTGQNKRGQCALLDADGHAMTDYLFQDITPLCDSTFWATQSKKRAQFTRSDKWINFGVKHLKFLHYDAKGQLLPDTPCQSIEVVADGMAYKFVRDGRYEFWDACGKPMLTGTSWQFEVQLQDIRFDDSYTRRTVFPPSHSVPQLVGSKRCSTMLVLVLQLSGLDVKTIFVVDCDLIACFRVLGYFCCIDGNGGCHCVNEGQRRDAGF